MLLCARCGGCTATAALCEQVACGLTGVPQSPEEVSEMGQQVAGCMFMAYGKHDLSSGCYSAIDQARKPACIT